MHLCVSLTEGTCVCVCVCACVKHAVEADVVRYHYAH